MSLIRIISAFPSLLGWLMTFSSCACADLCGAPGRLSVTSGHGTCPTGRGQAPTSTYGIMPTRHGSIGKRRTRPRAGSCLGPHASSSAKSCASALQSGSSRWPAIYIGPGMCLAARMTSMLGTMKPQDLSRHDLPTTWQMMDSTFELVGCRRGRSAWTSPGSSMPSPRTGSGSASPAPSAGWATFYSTDRQDE